MPSAVNATDQQTDDQDDGASANDITVIRAQTFEALQILRNLLSLMMPKEDDGGPKLVDLIAALVAQQREIATGITRLQTDVNALFNKLDGNGVQKIQPGRAD